MKKNILITFTLLILIILCFIFISINKTNSLAQKKLTFWSIQLKPIYEKELQNIIRQFEKTHPEYKIVWVDIPIQEAQKRTLASILSSNPPDLINLNPDFSVILAERNALYNFKESDTEQFNPSLVNRLKYNKKIYALPFYATSPVTIYNKKIYNKCVGNDFISNYHELYSISKHLTSCSKIPAFNASLNENDTLSKILNKYNINSLSSDEEKRQANKVYSMFNEMYRENTLPKDILAINHREVIEKYMAEKALIIVAGSNFINMIKQNANDVYNSSAIDFQLTGENKKYDVSLMNLIIPKKSKNIEAAIDFALLLTSTENQLKLSKLTNVLPANKYALDNNYFKNCSNDLVDKSRCISANQLNNLNDVHFDDKNKKSINEAINKTLEEILLSNKISKKEIENKIETLSKTLKELQN